MNCPLCKKEIKTPNYNMGIAVCDSCDNDDNLQQKMKDLSLKVGHQGLTRIMKGQYNFYKQKK